MIIALKSAAAVVKRTPETRALGAQRRVSSQFSILVYDVRGIVRRLLNTLAALKINDLVDRYTLEKSFQAVRMKRIVIVQSTPLQQPEPIALGQVQPYFLAVITNPIMQCTLAYPIFDPRLPSVHKLVGSPPITGDHRSN